MLWRSGSTVLFATGWSGCSGRFLIRAVSIIITTHLFYLFYFFSFFVSLLFNSYALLSFILSISHYFPLLLPFFPLSIFFKATTASRLGNFRSICGCTEKLFMTYDQRSSSRLATLLEGAHCFSLIYLTQWVFTQVELLPSTLITAICTPCPNLIQELHG